MRPRLPSKLELRELAINHSGELVILLNRLEILRVNRGEQIHNPLESILRNLLKIVGASVERREFILDLSYFVLKIADLDQPAVRNDAHPIVLFPQIVNRKRAVFHVHRLEDGNGFVDELVVGHVCRSPFRISRCCRRRRNLRR